MKKTFTIILAGATALLFSNCTTTYDAYGNPRQSVDPGTAAVGAVAAGVLGYAIANNRNDNNHYYHNNNYYRPAPRRYYRHY